MQGSGSVKVGEADDGGSSFDEDTLGLMSALCCCLAPVLLFDELSTDLRVLLRALSFLLPFTPLSFAVFQFGSLHRTFFDYPSQKFRLPSNRVVLVASGCPYDSR